MTHYEEVLYQVYAPYLTFIERCFAHLYFEGRFQGSLYVHCDCDSNNTYVNIESIITHTSVFG